MPPAAMPAPVGNTASELALAMTVTVRWQVVQLPNRSQAVTRIVCTPGGSGVLTGGLWTTVTGPPQLSVALR